MAKREPHWVKLFLRELQRTGNVRLAAEGAGVDFTTAYQRRKRHADFAERWNGALAAHAAQDPSTTGSAASGPPPPDKLGEELHVRPDGKIIKSSEARWGKRAEEAFLVELTTSANVRVAARSAGFSTQAVYRRRMKDRRFAAAWDAALEAGKARVQAYLVEAATRTFDPDEMPIADEREIPKVSISEAINIAKLKGAAEVRPSTGSGQTGWGPYEDDGFDGRPITREEWEQAGQNIVNRLARIRERDEEEERETGRCRCCGQPLPVEPLPAQT